MGRLKTNGPITIIVGEKTKSITNCGKLMHKLTIRTKEKQRRGSRVRHYLAQSQKKLQDKKEPCNTFDMLSVVRIILTLVLFLENFTGHTKSLGKIIDKRIDTCSLLCHCPWVRA
jgi:hypothetical protein